MTRRYVLTPESAAQEIQNLRRTPVACSCGNKGDLFDVTRLVEEKNALIRELIRLRGDGKTSVEILTK